MNRQVPIIQTVAALESMRKRGITLQNAILECVDNSWDWMGNAKLMNDARIRIHAEMNDDGSLTVSILDSGEGITIVQEDPVSGEGVPVETEEESDMDGLQMAYELADA